jgi:uncharacterized membrane protein YgcG
VQTRRFRPSRLLFVLALVGVICAGGRARADTSASIPDYRITLTVQSNGALHVQEVINYDFGAEPGHGIIRLIPDRVPYDKKHDRVYPISNVVVTTSPGTPSETSMSHDGGNLRIRVGDPDRTISATHTYTIDYDVDGAIAAFPDHAELYWNAVGNEWTVPITAATVQVRGPATVTKVACYRGPTGSNYPCQRAMARGQNATYLESSFLPGSGLTVVAAFPPGSVTATGPILHERPNLASFFAPTALSLTLTGLVLAAVIGGLGWLWWARGRDRRYVGQIPGLAPAAGQSTADARKPLFGGPPIAVEFAPPDSVRPGEVGTLLDEQANTLDVTATIVDLAVRKFLTIKEIEPEHRFGHKDWELTHLEPEPKNETLFRYERHLVDSLFKGERASVRLSELRNTFAPELNAVESQLYADAVSKGWFVRRPDSVRRAWQGVGIGVMIAGAILTIAFAKTSTHLGLVGLAIIFGGFAIWAIRNAMPARTAKGSAMLARIRGFRTYLETAEAEQLKFEEREQLFARYLPFAIVFGVTDHWAKVFESLATDNPQMSGALGWYVGPAGWNLAYFAASMTHFTTATSGVIASHAPAGSPMGFSSGGGFSMGGGFSGGGGGGGGGGGW